MKFKNIKLLTFFTLGIFISCHQTKKLSEFDYNEEEKEEFTTQESENTPYFNDQAIVLNDHRYIPTIKTDQLLKTGIPFSIPIINLNSNQTLTLSFDDLTSDVEDYYYKIIHCDANWNKTDILENQYIEGFFSDAITDYDFSFNTLIPYVHYELEFPNQNMRMKISGNYILLVIKDNEDDQPILSKRFMVFENQVSIVPRIRRSPANKDRNYKQLVEFEILHPNFEIRNPYRDLEVVVRQNARWDNALTQLKPIYIKDRRLIYEAQNKYSFNGGNEYRFFNLRSIHYQTEQVGKIQQLDDGYHAWLIPFGKRNFSMYTTRYDLNGRYEIKTTDANNSKTEAEYVKVHFTLPFEEPMLDANLYVMGDFSNRQTHKENQLYYNDEKSQYEAIIPLKQGFYDYQYVVVKDGDEQIDSSLIEGSHFETENDYDILVYYKDISDDYQRLIGAIFFDTNNY